MFCSCSVISVVLVVSSVLSISEMSQLIAWIYKLVEGPIPLTIPLFVTHVHLEVFAINVSSLSEDLYPNFEVYVM